MVRYLSLTLFLSVNVAALQGMCGEWISLDASRKEQAKNGAIMVKKANEDLEEEAQSRNPLVIYNKNLQTTLFSGVSPFKKFSTNANEGYFSFIDVLIGKEKADALFYIANESREILLEFQREFNREFNLLKSKKKTNDSKEGDFFKKIEASGINGVSSLADFERCVALLKTSSMQSWRQLLERLEEYNSRKKQLNYTEGLFIEYIEALKRYLLFLKMLPCLSNNATLLKAIVQINFLEEIAQYLPSERIIDTISGNSDSIAAFTHTETLLAYIMFSDVNNLVEPKLTERKRCFKELFKKSALEMFSHRDMCSVCEETWAHFANTKETTVVFMSNKKYENSHLRHRVGSFLKKIPLSSDMHFCWKTAGRDRQDSKEKWTDIFLYNFSSRMSVLLNTSPALLGIIAKSKELVLAGIDDDFLFDELIDNSATVIRASEIYNNCVRHFLYETTDVFKETLKREHIKHIFKEFYGLLGKFFKENDSSQI